MKNIERRIVKSFLDIAILSILNENEDLNGYQILEHIFDKIGILIGSGTVYSTLYALERKQFVRGAAQFKSRTYRLTSKGKAVLKEIDKIVEAFNLFMTQFCSYKVKARAL
jgi:DNA-binding PadR family transcriptional regulator